MLEEMEKAPRSIKNRSEERGHKACLIDRSIGTGAIAIVEAGVSWRELIALAETNLA
jgi:hypothetical protein